MYTDNEVLFPHQAIPSLKNLGGKIWHELVEHVLTLPESHQDHLAFMLLMIRLNGCMNCETDSYRAMRGCTACAQQTLRRFKGTDEELITMFEKAKKDIRSYALRNQNVEILMPSLL